MNLSLKKPSNANQSRGGTLPGPWGHQQTSMALSITLLPLIHWPPAPAKLRPCLELHCAVPVSSPVWRVQGVFRLTWGLLQELSCSHQPDCLLSLWTGRWYFYIVWFLVSSSWHGSQLLVTGETIPNPCKETACGFATFVKWGWQCQHRFYVSATTAASKNIFWG